MHYAWKGSSFSNMRQCGRYSPLQWASFFSKNYQISLKIRSIVVFLNTATDTWWWRDVLYKQCSVLLSFEHRPRNNIKPEKWQYYELESWNWFPYHIYDSHAHRNRTSQENVWMTERRQRQGSRSLCRLQAAANSHVIALAQSMFIGLRLQFEFQYLGMPNV